MTPLLAFLATFFILPLAGTLLKSVHAPEVPRTMPRTAGALESWNEITLPDETVYRALLLDLREAYENKTIADAASRLNHEDPGFRRLLLASARQARKMDESDARRALVEHDPAWGDLRTWRAILSARHEYTPRYLLAAVDLERRAGGSIGPAPAEQRVHVQLLAQTLWISLVVTLLCLAIGYPLAYTMASLPGRWGALLLVVVLLPFWTSALVRTAAWMVLLRKDGVINTIFLALGVAAEPFELIFNRFSVYVAMVYVMLPFMVLPLYSAMRSIDPGQVRAAESLGARPPVAFFTVYLPQTAPGVSAGSILVFIQTLGFYVTPALVGGRQDQMISMVIANYALGTANWNMAAAVSVVLLVCIALVYPIFTRFAGTAPLGIR